MKGTSALLAALLCAATIASAQTSQQPQASATPARDPHSGAVKQHATTVRGLVLRTAEKVPEELYSFKPVDTVRSMGALLGHIADGNFLLCRFAAGESPKIETPNEKKTTKAEIIEGLKASFAFCDQVAATIDDTTGAEPVKLFGQPTTKLAVLAFNNNHTWEHYGNLVTYMRLKNIVPPSSERAQD